MKVVLDEGARLPERAHADDAGLDLFSRERKVIPAHGSALFDIGVHMEIQHGYFGKIESKSGLNVKHGVVSCGGVIDSGFSGSITVKLYNLSDEDYEVLAGDKIAQLVLIPIAIPRLVVVEKLGETERGSDGFGSTGR